MLSLHSNLKLHFMQKLILFIFMILVGFATQSQAQTCNACFTATTDTSSSNYLLTLDATCSNASANATYDWILMGIPFFSSNQPVFQIPFSASGTYDITLVVTDGTCTDSSTQYVTLNTICDATFIPYLVTPSTVYFNSVSSFSPNATYTWDFGDGNTGSGSSSYHVYAAAGNYNVCLTVTDTACTDTYCQGITTTGGSVNNGCIASFTQFVDPILGYLTADASGSAYDPLTTTFNWILNGSLIQQSSSPYLNIPLLPGTYTLDLVLLDANFQPCDSSTQIIVYTSGSSSSCYACMNSSYNLTYDSVYVTSCSVVPNGGSLQWLVNGTVLSNNSAGLWLGFNSPGLQSITLYVLDSLNTPCDSTFQYVYTYAPPCTSCLTVTPVSGSTSDFVFDGSCSPNGYLFNWFVDGNFILTTNNPQFTYSFTGSGNYNVCLESADTNGNFCTTACTSVVVNTPTATNFNLAGKVYKYNGVFNQVPAGAGEAKVYLIKLMTGGTLVPIDSTYTDASGFYNFGNKPIDDYRVKAALEPTSADYSINIPTYYYGGYMWYDATVVTLFTNVYNKDVFLQYGFNAGGNGFIAGNVFQGANKGGKTRSNGPTDVTILLLDAVNNQAVAYAKPDAQGNYSFNNVAFGNYKLVGELLNRASISENISLNGSQTSLTNKNFMFNDNVIQPTNMSLSVNNTATTGSDLDVFPNPSHSMVRILSKDGAPQINILDVTGRLVFSSHLQQGKAESIDCSSWTKGLYFIQSKEGSNSRTQKLLIQ